MTQACPTCLLHAVIVYYMYKLSINFLRMHCYADCIAFYLSLCRTRHHKRCDKDHSEAISLVATRGMVATNSQHRISMNSKMSFFVIGSRIIDGLLKAGEDEG